MSGPAAPAASGGLTRELLLSGDLPRMIAEQNPEIRVLSEAERRASLDAMLRSRPETGQGVWVFAYGSLIWNPLFHYVERRRAHVPGWRRSFCLKVKMGRGTPENPGLMLGLAADRAEGPGCTGVAFRIEEALVDAELDLLWRREMVAAGYIPRWVELRDDAAGQGAGTRFGHAIAFTINPEGPSYCGDLPEEEVVERLATARGRLGSAAEYLMRTHAGLAELGIVDPFVEGLAQKVDARLSAAA